MFRRFLLATSPATARHSITTTNATLLHLLLISYISCYVWEFKQPVLSIRFLGKKMLNRRHWANRYTTIKLKFAKGYKSSSVMA